MKTLVILKQPHLQIFACVQLSQGELKIISAESAFWKVRGQNLKFKFLVKFCAYLHLLLAGPHLLLGSLIAGIAVRGCKVLFNKVSVEVAHFNWLLWVG